MHWIIQDSGGKHYNWTALYDAVRRAGGTAEFCSVSAALTLKRAEPVVVFGGEDFLEAARKNANLESIIFHAPSFFRVDTYLRCWGNDCLNADTFFYDPSREYSGEDGRYFVRPLFDTKCFDGGIYPLRHGEIFRMESCRNCRQTGPCMCVSSEKHIREEWRFVVISDRVVTGSPYVGAASTPQADTEQIMRFAQRMADRAQGQAPAVWVLDIGLTKEGCKVIEANIFNASNLYECSRDIIVRGMDGLLSASGGQQPAARGRL